MAITVNSLARKFIIKKAGKEVELSDFNPAFSPEKIMDFYSTMYPDLTTATIHGPEIKPNLLVYEFKTTVGVKG